MTFSLDASFRPMWRAVKFGSRLITGSNLIISGEQYTISPELPARAVPIEIAGDCFRVDKP
jgi:hypothetical protein